MLRRTSNILSHHSPSDSPSTYNTGYGPVSNEDQRRWMASQDGGYRHRDRRSDCRSLPSIIHPTHAPPLQHNTFPNNYMASPDQLRTQSFQQGYIRTPQEDLHWDSWNVDVDPRSSPNNQPQRFADVNSSWNNSLAVQIPQYDPRAFDLFSSSDSSSSSTLYTPPPEPAIPLNGYTFPHRISPAPSPSPSPVQGDVKPHFYIPSSPSCGPRRGSDDRSESGKSCSHCRATSTPLWRRDPSTMKPLCNACGLYLQQRNKLRPQELIDADDDGTASDDSDANYVGPECSHCRTHHTSVWRRSKTGEQLCNACGVYQRLRGKPRPLSLKKNKIRPRSKHPPK